MNKKADPKTQDIEECKKKQSELEEELNKIREKKEEVQKEKERELSALYAISLDKNKLFEDEIKAYPIKSYVESRRRKRFLNHFLCLFISLSLAVSIAGLISFSGIQNIFLDKTITITITIFQVATVVLLSYLVVFLLTFIHISINYLFSGIEVNKRIIFDKIKKGVYTSSCIAVIALAACIILSFW